VYVRRIRIKAGNVIAAATLVDNATADAVWAALPLTARANRWGDEIYFEIPVRLPQAEDARDVLQAGELGYWPMGRAFCIFWGPTPASQGGEIRAYSEVNVFGRLDGDAAAFASIQSGSAIEIEAGS
jgi:hypothetical protein